MSTPAPALVPPVPEDYYARIYAVERGHWWHRGMREITAALLGERLTGAGTILDAGCGTGGFLAWAGERAPGARLLGADVSEQAVALARTRVPGAQVALAPLHAMPFENGTADLVACNDVLQHVREPELEASVAELRRVTRPGGALVVRTGGARCARAEREDWRIFDAPGIAGAARGLRPAGAARDLREPRRLGVGTGAGRHAARADRRASRDTARGARSRGRPALPAAPGRGGMARAPRPDAALRPHPARARHPVRARAAPATAALLAAALVLVGCGLGGSGGGDRDQGRFVVREDCPPAPPARLEQAPPPAPGTVQVTGRRAQTMDGWGASVVGDTFVDPLVDPVGLRPAQVRELDRLVFDKAGVDMVRVFGPGYGRAPVVASAAQRRRDASFAFMRRVAPYGVRFMYTGTTAPAALREDGRLRPGAEAAYGRYIADYLRSARELGGVSFDYAAVANEPDNRASRLTMSPAQASEVAGALALRLHLEAQPTRLVAGDTTGWGTTCPYIRAQLSLPPVRAATAAVASHAYYGSARQAASVAALARSAGKPVWQTEWGTGCATCRERNEMHTAINWSRRIATDLVSAQASAWFTFRAVADSTHGPEDALIVRRRGDRAAPWLLTKRFYVFRQYSSAAPRGARRLEVRTSARGVPAVAFRSGAGTTVVLTNRSASSVHRVRLDLGRATGTLSVRRTSRVESFTRLRPARYRGRPLTVTLPPESVTTYTLAGAGA